MNDARLVQSETPFIERRSCPRLDVNRFDPTVAIDPTTSPPWPDVATRIRSPRFHRTLSRRCFTASRYVPGHATVAPPFERCTRSRFSGPERRRSTSATTSFDARAHPLNEPSSPVVRSCLPHALPRRELAQTTGSEPRSPSSSANSTSPFRGEGPRGPRDSKEGHALCVPPSSTFFCSRAPGSPTCDAEGLESPSVSKTGRRSQSSAAPRRATPSMRPRCFPPFRNPRARDRVVTPSRFSDRVSHHAAHSRFRVSCGHCSERQRLFDQHRGASP